MNDFVCIFMLSIALLLTPMVSFSKLVTASSATLNNNNEHQSNPSNDNVLEELIEKYQSAIESIESEQGTYSSQLTQELLNLSDLYQKHGDHHKAVDILKRSLHLTRINEGLYSSNQIPIVNKLIFNLKASKQWDLVNDRYYYLYQIYHRIYNEDDVELLDVGLTLANWHLQSSLLDLMPKPLNGLIASHSLFSQAERLITEQYGENDMRLIQVLNGLMVTQYLLSINIDKVETPRDVYSQFQMSSSSQYVSSVYRNSFANGKDLIERELHVLEFQPEKNHLDITKNKLKLADWYLINNKNQSAVRYYQNAYNYALSHDSNNDFTQILFGQPVALPDLPYINGVGRSNVNGANLPETARYVEVLMDVSRYGDTRNIKVVSAKPKEIISKRYKVISYLRNLKLRPRLVDGTPVVTKELPFHVFLGN